MAKRGFTFIETRAPRAAGLSEGALNKHKELIGDLYLSRNHTRDQVIQHLETNFGFSISRDQFSKATRRWGFQKQRRTGSSIQPSPSDRATQCATRNATKAEPLSTIDINGGGEQESTPTNESSNRPRSAGSSSSYESDTTTHGSSSTFVRPFSKRIKTRNESDNTPASSLSHTELYPAEDTDLKSTSAAEEEEEEEITPTKSRYEDRYDHELSAEYLACCYCYNKAFSHYLKVSVPLQDETFSPKQRRDMILNMARTAKTRRASEIVRKIIESELERSIDPLSEDESNQFPSDKAEMCPMQSFLFHRHLAEIYEHRRDGASLVQKHLDTARGFTKAFGIIAPPPTLSLSDAQVQITEAKSHNTLPSINLWTLLRLLPRYRVAEIPEDLLNALEWHETSQHLDAMDCLDRCWGALTNSEFLPTTIHYDAGKHENISPTDMRLLALQQDSLDIWTKTSILFTFLWAKIQDRARIWKPRMISATQFLMVMSRMIVRRSLLFSRHENSSLDSENSPLELRASDRRVYSDVVEVLIGEQHCMQNVFKREFVTEFVEHYSWSPPAGRKSVLVRQIQTYQIEALESVLAARRKSHLTTPISITLKEVTALAERFSERRRQNCGFLYWDLLPDDQLDSASERETIAYAKRSRYTPSFDSSSVSSYLRPPSTQLNALNGNPTMCRSLASQSSRCSQVSASSSFKRFKESALKRLDSSEAGMMPSPEWHLPDDYTRKLEDLQVPRHFKVTRGLPTLEEDNSWISEEK